MRSKLFSFAFGALALSVTSSAFAAETGFKDVPSDHFAADAVAYLHARELIKGYDDGTFRPDKKVNRAEAVKMIASSIVDAKQLDKAGTSSFSDVPEDAWFAPYVAWAKEQGFVSGSGDKTKQFLASKTVAKAEFLKMLFLSRKVDLQAFGDTTAPLALDVSDSKQWYYPVIRYALATGVTATAQSGNISPAREVTRSDAAIFLYRFFQSREGAMTQELLTSAREDLERTLAALERGDVSAAEKSVVRAVLSARGAHQFKPEDTAVKVAVKTAEGYRSLVQAYRAGLSGDLDKVISLATAAWKSGDQAIKISSDASTLATQLQRYAKSFADQARANKQ